MCANRGRASRSKTSLISWPGARPSGGCRTRWCSSRPCRWAAPARCRRKRCANNMAACSPELRYASTLPVREFPDGEPNMSDNPPLLITRHGGVMCLSVNDAPWNRMSFAYMDALEAAIEAAAADPTVRALLFTGAGEANFSVGMDLKQMLLEGEARGGWDAVLDQRLRVLARIESLDKPSVATLFGYC